MALLSFSIHGHFYQPPREDPFSGLIPKEPGIPPLAIKHQRVDIEIKDGVASTRIEQVFHKSLLPTYDIFDEYRYFEPNREFSLLHFKGKKIAVTICEDLWFDQPAENAFSNSRLYTNNPLEQLAGLNPDLGRDCSERLSIP